MAAGGISKVRTDCRSLYSGGKCFYIRNNIENRQGWAIVLLRGHTHPDEQNTTLSGAYGQAHPPDHRYSKRRCKRFRHLRPGRFIAIADVCGHLHNRKVFERTPRSPSGQEFYEDGYCYILRLQDLTLTSPRGYVITRIHV
jgi:hypothetical protein